MTYFYNNYVAEHYGKINGKLWPEGTFITPDGTLFDVDGYASTRHGGGFVIPFFSYYINPVENMQYFRFHEKNEYLQQLIKWEKSLINKEYDVHPKEQKMRLYLVKYLINVYKSKNVIWDRDNSVVDFSKVTGILDVSDNSLGRYRVLKDILVQACNYDSIESTLYRTITTSKFNIYETFYDYILHDYKIYQIPKKIYDEEQEKYIDYKQSEFMIPDSELRLKEELNSICKDVPLEKRKIYCKSKIKEDRYDFIN